MIIYDRATKHSVSFRANKDYVADINNSVMTYCYHGSTPEFIELDTFDDLHRYVRAGLEPVAKAEYSGNKVILYGNDGVVYSQIARKMQSIHIGIKYPNFRVSIVCRMVCIQNGEVYQISHNAQPLMEYQEPNTLDVWLTKSSNNKIDKKCTINRKYYKDDNVFVTTIDYRGDTSTTIVDNILGIEESETIRVIHCETTSYIIDLIRNITISSDYPVNGIPVISYMPGQYSCIEGLGKFFNNERKIWKDDFRLFPCAPSKTGSGFAFYLNNRLARYLFANARFGLPEISMIYDIDLNETPDVFGTSNLGLYYARNNQIWYYDYGTKISTMFAEDGKNLKLIHNLGDKMTFCYDDDRFVIYRGDTIIVNTKLKLGFSNTLAPRGNSWVALVDGRIHAWNGKSFSKQKISKQKPHGVHPVADAIRIRRTIVVTTNCAISGEYCAAGIGNEIWEDQERIYRMKPGTCLDDQFEESVYSPKYKAIFSHGLPVDVQSFGFYMVEIHPNGVAYLNYNGITQPHIEGITPRSALKSSRTL